MVEINKNSESLEKALDKHDETPKTSKEEEVGFHKGALNTLVNERNELIKIIQNIESIMQAHMKRLEELGIKIDKK